MAHASTIIITGGTTGLGYEAALAIAKQKQDALIIISSRSDGNEAAATINKATAKENVRYARLDLASLEDVRRFVDEYTTKKYPPVSALLLNAGVQVVSGVTYTKEGLETTFGVNHVGNALLFYLLAPHLTSDARIIVTASGTHDPAQKTGMPDALYESAQKLAYPDEQSLAKNNGRQRYATSKLCNVLWTYALGQKIQRLEKQWTVAAIDPGLMPGTGLARDASSVEKFLWHSVLPKTIPVLRVLVSKNVHSPQESGGALASLAVGEELKVSDGAYYEGRKAIKSSEDSYVESKQEDLWRWTVEYLGKDVEEKKKFGTLS